MPLYLAKSLANPLRPLCGVESMRSRDNFGSKAAAPLRQFLVACLAIQISKHVSKLSDEQDSNSKA